MSSKFKVGDHVVVVKEFEPWFAVGDLGTVYETHSYSPSITKETGAYVNEVSLSIPEKYLEHSIIHNSPLYKALK